MPRNPNPIISSTASPPLQHLQLPPSCPPAQHYYCYLSSSSSSRSQDHTVNAPFSGLSPSIPCVVIMGIWKPAWLEALDTQKFFASCSTHEAAKKNEKNICCLDCCTSLCPHCLASHRCHRLVQVRRYVYHDVLRLEDLEKLFDCSNVQPYTINSSKVVFIKKRPQSRQFKGSGNICTSCDRILQEPYLHCSLGCKVDFVLRQKKDLSPYLRTCDSLPLNPDFAAPHDGRDDDGANDNSTTHSTVVDSDDPMGSSDSENLGCSAAPACTAEFVRKKRSGLYVICARSAGAGSLSNAAAADVAVNVNNRRKGIPHRSPLC